MPTIFWGNSLQHPSPGFWDLLHTCISTVNTNCRASTPSTTEHPKVETWIALAKMQYYSWCYLSHSEPSGSNCSCGSSSETERNSNFG